MATSLAPNHSVSAIHEFHLWETRGIEPVIGEMAIATLLNWDRRILRIRIGKDITFYLEDDVPYLHVSDAVAGHMVLVEQTLTVLDVPKRMIQNIKAEAYDGTGDVIIEQVFDHNSLLSKVERLLYGSTRRHWTWQKVPIND